MNQVRRDAVQRKIIHIDMDAFYASVEQRDNPEPRGKPVAVGHGAARGVVAAASYEARVFGVHSAMASVTAMRKCRDLIFVPPRFDVYRAVSAQIREIFAEHTAMVEPLSLDEAYLDVTDNLQAIPVATDIANAIRARIKDVTGLNSSAGISYNKFLAKMASGHNKPMSRCQLMCNGVAYTSGFDKVVQERFQRGCRQFILASVISPSSQPPYDEGPAYLSVKIFKCWS